MNMKSNPLEILLGKLIRHIAEGEEKILGTHTAPGCQLEFIVIMNYEVDGAPRKSILVFDKGRMLGRITPVYKEGTDTLIYWLAVRDTHLGSFCEIAEGPIDYTANYLLNLFLVDPEAIKTEFDERNRMRQKSQQSKLEEAPVKPSIYEVEMKDFIEVMRADMGSDKSELGKVLGVYKLTDIKTLKDLHFECFVAGNEYQNWVQCMVMECRGKFPRIYGSFRMNDTYAVIESRFFKGAIETAFDLGLADVINRILVTPHANYGTK